MINYPQAVYFGVPSNLIVGNTDIDSGLAATLSAKALKQSMDDVVNKFGGAQQVPEYTIKLFFEERLKHNFPLFLPGGRVNFNSTANLIATNYKTNFLTTGDCSD